MRINEDTVIVCANCLLVPYREHHVPRYHQWMESEELRTLTASDRLTLEQEHEMQKSWHLDDNKCTFIILNKKDHFVEQTTEQEIDTMVGDVNLFLSGEGDCLEAEVEIMIAEPEARGKGIGKTAVLAMMSYGIGYIHVKKFVTKIALLNTASISLFTKLGFIETERSEVFKEVTLEQQVTDLMRSNIDTLLGEITGKQIEYQHLGSLLLMFYGSFIAAFLVMIPQGDTRLTREITVST